MSIRQYSWNAWGSRTIFGYLKNINKEGEKLKKSLQEFMWGASTSAFQVEGAYNIGGKGLSIADIRSFKNSTKQMDTKVSVDHYHHLEEDVSLMKELGLKSYRFSISWARIFPKGDEATPNQEGLKFYHKLIKLLKKNDIEPIVTMYHFDQPYHLIEKYEGWVSRQSIDDFVKYAQCLFNEYGDKVKYWLTINEQAVMVVVPEMLGIKSELSNHDKLQKAYQANYHMWIAQAIVYKILRQNYPNSYIGPAVSYITTLPSSMSAEDMMAAKELEDFYSFSQMDVAIKGEIPMYFENELEADNIKIKRQPDDRKILLEGTANYLGVNWYCTTIVERNMEQTEGKLVFGRIKTIKNPKLKYTDWGWNFDPIGLRYGLRQLLDRYGNIPVVITECGWSQREELQEDKIHDTERINYLHDHIEQMKLAILDGVNVISFNPWSFIDLLSVGDGMEKRYGLVYVDRSDFDEKTMKRYKKDSFFYYQEMVKKNKIMKRG